MSISESEPNKRSAEQLLSDSKRQKTESSVKVVIPNVVIDVDNSDDDELEVLTMKLRKERSADDGVSTKKRIYYAMEPVKQQKIIISIDSDSDYEETCEASGKESIMKEAASLTDTKDAAKE